MYLITLFAFVAIIAVYFFYMSNKANNARRYHIRGEKQQRHQEYLNAMLKNRKNSK